MKDVQKDTENMKNKMHQMHKNEQDISQCAQNKFGQTFSQLNSKQF